MNQINEQTFSAYMSLYQEKEQDWEKVYEIIHGQVKEQEKENKYQSISSNYNALFFYELIKRQVDIQEFDKLTQKIIPNLLVRELDGIYSRFFSYNSDIKLDTYLKEDRYHNSLSVWCNMAYIFLDKKENDFMFHESTLPYLKSLIKPVNNYNVRAIYESGFHYYISNFFNNHNIENINQISEILEVTQNNPAFLKADEKIHLDFNSSLITLLGNFSYENIESKYIFNFFENQMKDFESHIQKKLIYLNAKRELKIDLSTLNLLLVCEKDIVSMINKTYQDYYFKTMEEQKASPFIQSDASMYQYKKEAPFLKLISDLNSTLSVGLKPGFYLNLNNMDINQDVFCNYIYLKCLDFKIENGDEDIVFSKETINYLQDVSQKCLQKECSYDIKNLINWENTIKWLHHKELNDLLKDKKKNKQKNKI